LPADPERAVELFASISGRLGADEARLRTAATVSRHLAAEGVSDPKTLRDAVVFVDDHVTRDPDVARYLADAGIAFSKLSDKTLASDIAAAFAKQDPSTSGASLAYTINSVHDRQTALGTGDSVREAIIAALPEAALARMLSSATTEMYPSTYAKSLARVRSL